MWRAECATDATATAPGSYAAAARIIASHSQQSLPLWWASSLSSASSSQSTSSSSTCHHFPSSVSLSVCACACVCASACAHAFSCTDPGLQILALLGRFNLGWAEDESRARLLSLLAIINFNLEYRCVCTRARVLAHARSHV